MLLTFALSGVLIAKFPAGSVEFAVSTGAFWFGDARGGAEIQFSLGLDGLSLWLFGLTSLLMITAIAVSWKAIDRYCRAYYSLLLVLETGMLGVFCAGDIILFYVFFEATLIPLFFLIGVWGSSDRRLCGDQVLPVYLGREPADVPRAAGDRLVELQPVAGDDVLDLGADKRPDATPDARSAPTDRFLGPVRWLCRQSAVVSTPHLAAPAHVEAPTAGSVVLAGILLKIGGYGFVRFSLPMLPEATALLMPWLVGLSAAGIIYGALVALAQADIKRLIAYSSVSHLGFCMLGIFAANRLGIQGGVLQMVNHGLSTGGLFALVGMLYERYHTREIKAYGGIARRLPVLASSRS